MNSKNIIVISIFIVAVSIGYYLVIYIPQRDKINEQNKLNTANSVIQARISCLRDADNRRVQLWNQTCSANGLSDNCGLPNENTNYINKIHENDKETCLRLYAQ